MVNRAVEFVNVLFFDTVRQKSFDTVRHRGYALNIIREPQM